ncbi:MAG TPA: hypothetical protein VGS96_09855 [Thermoanaerobaculia bacterium]|nr:hypothetical protein [Thermoanaerobaculia bacterium]
MRTNWKDELTEYLGYEIRRCSDGTCIVDARIPHVSSNFALNLVGAKSIVLAHVHRERHRAKWGMADDYEWVYLSEVGRAHYQKRGNCSTLCGLDRQDWLRCLPMDLGAFTMCKSCRLVFRKNVAV